MADTRKITIEILNSESGSNDSEKSGNIGADDNIGKTINKIMHPIKSAENVTIGKTVILNQAYQQAKQMLTQTIDLSLNRYYTLTEDYLGQTNYQHIRTAYGKVTGLASSIAGGAMTGGMAGPVGAAIGAVIGATSWGINQTIQNQANLSGYYQDLNAANFNMQFNRTRAGLVNEGRGTDN
jgi:hypothetical protein